jgi:hypothetical protein
MLSYEHDIKDSFYELSDDEKDIVMQVAANFHYRNGVKHPDGSLGEIRITNRQLTDCFAYMFIMKS